MVEFLRDPDTGEFELMEVNPRFWSSLPFTVQAGVDFPMYYWRVAQGDPIPNTPDYEVGTAGHLLRGELCYLHSVLTEEYPLVSPPSFGAALRRVGASLARYPRFDYPTIDDPKPFVRDLVRAVRSDDADAMTAPETSEEPAMPTSAGHAGPSSDGPGTAEQPLD
jgi:predicted ATP-grasp superfamily ATP-dependent carboligase